VISNLLSNAVKYSEKGSPISLEAAGDGREISIAVKDRGVGIPADEVGNLFQRFYRASSANGVAGTGIGLHLVQHLVGLHGGRLTVHSVLGEGSRFAVHLPIPDALSISGEALGPLATVAAAA
jgi:signal transduction histidine kinase